MSDLPTPIPAELARLRGSIDNIDAALVTCWRSVSRPRSRWACSRRPAACPSDPAREEQQVARLRELARTADLDPVFAGEVPRVHRREVIRHHEAIAEDHARGA